MGAHPPIRLVLCPSLRIPSHLFWCLLKEFHYAHLYKLCNSYPVIQGKYSQPCHFCRLSPFLVSENADQLDIPGYLRAFVNAGLSGGVFSVISDHLHKSPSRLSLNVPSWLFQIFHHCSDFLFTVIDNTYLFITRPPV